MATRRQKSQKVEPSRLAKLGKWAVGQLPGVLTGVAGLAAFAGTTYFQQLDKIGAHRLADYEMVVKEQKVFYGLLNSYTLRLTQAGVPDQTKAEELTASIVQQYLNVGAFAANVDTTRKEPFREYQTALNDVKNRVLEVRRFEDLDPLAVSLVNLHRKQVVSQFEI